MPALFTYLIKAPLSFIYGCAVYIRNKLYDWKVFKTTVFDFPIINIGNITVGGTGKTPHVEYLLSILTYNKIATLSRGYKRKSKGFRYIQATDTIEIAGDEPLQVKQKFPEVIVTVDANRVYGINKIIDDNPTVKAVILDDAFQHRKVTPTLNIVLIDFNHPVYNDHFLPWGRLRDSITQLSRADIFIVTKCPEDLKDIDIRFITKHLNPRPYQQLFFTSLEYGEKKPVFDDLIEPNIYKEGESILTITGIASPSIFINYVNKYFGETYPLTFPDHHNFTKNDINQICKIAADKKWILTTEKDCVRLRQWNNSFPDEIKAKMFYIPIKVKFLMNEWKFINTCKKIINLGEIG